MPNPSRLTRPSLLIFASIWAFGFLIPKTALGQLDGMRFELGKRLTRFERAWQEADDRGRTASVESMDRAVRSFFGLQLDTAASLLDQATQDLGNRSPDERQKWIRANRFSIDFEVPWVDASHPVLRFRWRTLTNSERDTARLGPGVLELAVIDHQHQILARESREDFFVVSSEQSSNEGGWQEWHLPELLPGDYEVSATYRADGLSIDLIAEGISVSRDRNDRLTKAANWYEEHRRDKGDTATATAKWLAREMKEGQQGRPTEIDIPWDAWLYHFESLCHSPTEFFETMLRSGPRSVWVQLFHDGKTQLVRLGIPSPSTEPLPVLFAFHGAGGSENMFFEAYGAGRLVSLANERGWLVVSPRQTLNGLNVDIEGMLDSLSEQLPIDRSRVMLVGHSMGASQAIAQVSTHPDIVIGVAALGGGGSAKTTLRSKGVRFMVAAGDRDFGRPRAKSLADALSKLECDVEYREYPNVEHMVIVQAALDDVFRFLDQIPKP